MAKDHLRAVKPGEEYDPWKLEDDLVPGDYHREKRYCASTDGRGHKEQLHLSLPPALMGHIAKLVNMGAFPEYGSSVHAFIRDSLYHNVIFRAEQIRDEGLVRAVTNDMRLAEIDQQQHELETAEAIVENARKLMDKEFQNRDYERLGKMVQVARGHAATMGQPYRGQLYEMVDQYEPRVVAWENDQRD